MHGLTTGTFAIALVVSTAFAAERKEPQEYYGQCHDLYGKTTFMVDGKDNVITQGAAFAAKQGPCTAGLGDGASVFVPLIDKQGGATMQEARTANEINEIAVASRRNLAAYKRVQPQEVRAKLSDVMKEAKDWSGPAAFHPEPVRVKRWEALGGNPVAGGDYYYPQGYYPSQYPGYAVNQYGEYVRLDPVGQGSQGLRRAGESLTNSGVDAINNLPPDPRAIVALPLGVGAAVVGGATQFVGGFFEALTSPFGYGYYQPSYSEEQWQRAQRREYRRQQREWERYYRDRGYN